RRWSEGGGWVVRRPVPTMEVASDLVVGDGVKVMVAVAKMAVGLAGDGGGVGNLKRRGERILVASLVESNSPEFDHISDVEEQSGEEVSKTMTETMEQYMSKTRGDYGSGVTRTTINQDTHFELKGQFLKELRDNTFSGSEHEDANEHIEKVLEIVDLFHIPKITQDQIMLRAFPVSLTGAASRWLRNQPSRPITTWEVLKTKFLNKYCPLARTAKK
ncbi:hypothetical protein Tco_1299459, partial [Tanacetum coccineum]